MYVTRPLSMYRKNPAALSEPPPEGPNSGILVFQDEGSEPKCCFGFAKSDRIRQFPIPQNKNVEIYYSQGFSRDRDLHFHSVWFVPVLGQPLSSNTYYAVHPLGKDRGEAFVCSTEVEMETCCFYSYAPETQPQPFDPRNIYQQMEISVHGRKITPWGSDFEVHSVVPNGFAPGFLGRSEGWKLLISSNQSHEFDLGDAQGLNAELRARLPDFDFTLACEKSMPVVVGKWYSPFIFVKEGTPKTMRDQKRMSMFYEVTLEQNWEQIFACDKISSTNEGNSVVVDAVVKSEVVVVGGKEAVVDERDLGIGVLWFRSVDNLGEETSVGLNLALVVRMKWEQERVGCVVGKEKEVRVEKREENLGEWKRFGCYVLVERFVFKRLDGSLALTHKFWHTHQIRTKWE